MSKTAIVFAGQGAQTVGMGKDLADAFPSCAALFRRADEVLEIGLSKICFEGPIEALTKSDNCQPAIFVASLACAEALRESSPTVAAAGVAGLSLGEWTALHSAGVLSFDDALRVLQARGRFMQEACDARAGGMVSIIGLADEALREVCAATGVEIANMNSPEQTVLSGPKERLADAERVAKEKGARKTVVLNVAGAFHSSLMAPAAAKLEVFLKDVKFGAPKVPVVANVTGQPHGGPEDIRNAMVRQVTQTVRWVSCVEWFRGRGVNAYIECGPGKVLTGLIKRIDAAAALHNVQDKATLDKTVAALGSCA
jgi:[acyl-carrier-protein] S-malonyltransferase